MAAHRYWRLLVSDNAAGTTTGVVIGELVLAVTPGGATVASGGTVSVSDFIASQPGTMAFDGINTAANGWRSVARTPTTGPGQWIQYDFGGSPRDIVEMRISYPPAGTFSAGMAPRNFVLYWSDNNTTWTRQRAWSEQVFGFGQTNTYDTTPIPSVSVTNRIVLSLAKFRQVAGAMPQGFFPSLIRAMPSVLRANNFTRPVGFNPYTGRFRISGSTTVLGLPKARRVDLLDQKSGTIVARMYTASDGVFSFNQLADGVYCLIGVDNSAEQNSVIYAHVTPVA